MAEIAATTLSGPTAVTEVELTGTDTLGARSGTLVIRNGSASSVTINIDGDAAGTKTVRGIGEVDLSSGYDIEVGTSETQAISLGYISDYLRGATVNVTGGASDVFAFVVQ